MSDQKTSSTARHRKTNLFVCQSVRVFRSSVCPCRLGNLKGNAQIISLRSLLLSGVISVNHWEQRVSVYVTYCSSSSNTVSNVPFIGKKLNNKSLGPFLNDAPVAPRDPTGPHLWAGFRETSSKFTVGIHFPRVIHSVIYLLSA